MVPKDNVSYADLGRRDKLAFALVVAFVIQMYSIPGEWISWAAPLRIALVTSGAAAALMVLRRLGKAEPIALDGLRGFGILGLLALAFASQKWSVAPDATHAWALELAKLVAIYFTVV